MVAHGVWSPTGPQDCPTVAAELPEHGFELSGCTVLLGLLPEPRRGRAEPLHGRGTATFADLHKQDLLLASEPPADSGVAVMLRKPPAVALASSARYTLQDAKVVRRDTQTAPTDNPSSRVGLRTLVAR